MGWLISHKEVTQLSNIFLVFKLFGLIISTLFMLIYINVPPAALFAVQVVHATNKRDQFLMKLQLDFEIARSNMMNRHPVPSLDACLSEILREE